MQINNLPEDLIENDSSPIQIYNYTIHNNFHRNKINLTKNTISFLIHGTKEVFGSDEPTRIDNNRFLIMKSGKCLMTENISNTNNTYKSLLLFFTDDMVIDFLEKNQIKLPAKKESDSFYVCDYDRYIRHYVESLEQILTLNKQLQRSLLKTKFEELMLYLVQKEGEVFLNNILQKQSETSIRLSHVVENNRLNKLTLQELSFLCNMSLSTFKREFSKQYKTTPSKWFQEQRLEHAALLLSTQKKRPIELFEDAGYESFSNFVQAFKKKYGITPKQYQIES